jgi:putative ABC transport system permease protein
MIFFQIVGKNLLHRPTRSLLTLSGIAIGISAVVALTSIAWGFQRSWERADSARGADLILMKVTTRDPMGAPFDATLREEVMKLPQVTDASGLLSDLVSIEDSAPVLVFGWEREGFLWKHLRLTEGRWPKDDGENAAVIGSVAAGIMNKKVGSTVHIEAEDFTICGVFESDAIIENGCLVMALPQLQRVLEKAGKITYLYLKVSPETTPAQLEQLRGTIKSKYEGFRALTSGEVARNNTAIQLAKAMSWATSLLALFVGAVGVMNTVLMSVFERTHEIGILLAIGWRRSRIVRMILYEATVLSFLGGILGIVFGFASVKLLEMLPWMQGKIQGEMSLQLFAIAGGVALALGILGGVYPAYRASCLHPNEALRYE